MAVLTEPQQPLPAAIQTAIDTLKQQAGSQKIDSDQVASAAKPIADNLKTAELRTQLGEAGLVDACGALLSSVRGETEPSTQLLRVIGNLAFDHNENRARALEAGVLSAIVSLLSSTLAAAQASSELDLTTLKLIRAAVGAVLNLSLKYDPIQRELAQPEPLKALLAILDSTSAAPVYIVGAWATAAVESEERIKVGAMIVSWAVNILEDVLEKDKSSIPPECVTTLASVILPVASTSAATSTTAWTAEDAAEFAESDLELLTSAASLLEALSIDLDSAKQAIAFAAYAAPPDHTPPTLLSQLFDFIENAAPPRYWHTVEDAAFGHKGFATVKSAVMRAVVEAPNSDEVMNTLFAGAEAGKRSWVVEKLVGWVREPKEGREDLLICAAHMLAALGRKDEHCVVLVHDYNLAPALAAITATHTDLQLGPPQSRPQETTQILFGVISLLRHLAIPAKNKLPVGNTAVITTVAPLLREQLDVVGPLQNAVIGLLKHLTAGSVPNSLALLAEPAPASGTATAQEAQAAPIDLLLPLIPRTDDVRLRSEATRVLINVIRSLFSTRAPSASNSTPTISPVTAFPGTATLMTAIPNTAATVTPESSVRSDEERKKAGRLQVVRDEVVAALAEMVRLSEKYPMLINEAIVGLTLLAGSGAKGALLVLDALLAKHAPAPPPAEAVNTLQDPDQPLSPVSPTSASGRTTSLAISAQGDPPQAVGMIVNWFGLTARGQLDDKRPSDVRPEMVTNAAALVITVLRTGEVAIGNGGITDQQRKTEVRAKLGEVRAKVVGSLTGAKEEVDAALSANEGLKRTLARAIEVVTDA